MLWNVQTFGFYLINGRCNAPCRLGFNVRRILSLVGYQRQTCARHLPRLRAEVLAQCGCRSLASKSPMTSARDWGPQGRVCGGIGCHMQRFRPPKLHPNAGHMTGFVATSEPPNMRLLSLTSREQFSTGEAFSTYESRHGKLRPGVRCQYGSTAMEQNGARGKGQRRVARRWLARAPLSSRSIRM